LDAEVLEMTTILGYASVLGALTLGCAYGGPPGAQAMSQQETTDAVREWQTSAVWRVALHGNDEWLAPIAEAFAQWKTASDGHFGSAGYLMATSCDVGPCIEIVDVLDDCVRPDAVGCADILSLHVRLLDGEIFYAKALHVALHELGHTVGLEHSEFGVMRPTFSIPTVCLSDADVLPLEGHPTC
jgi:hypothetical protein